MPGRFERLRRFFPERQRPWQKSLAEITHDFVSHQLTFSPEVSTVFQQASLVARRLKHEAIEPFHFVLGLSEQDMLVLAQFGFNPGQFEEQIVSAVGIGIKEKKDLDFSMPSIDALRSACIEALHFPSKTVLPLDIVAGILQYQMNFAATFLRRQGVDRAVLDKIRKTREEQSEGLNAVAVAEKFLREQRNS
jgi:ATP-dependent Clp protease ATP-binding subunit ClpA